MADHLSRMLTTHHMARLHSLPGTVTFQSLHGYFVVLKGKEQGRGILKL